MQIPIPNKDQIDKTSLLRVELQGFKVNPSGPASVAFSLTPTVQQILDSETFEIDDELLKGVQYVQFKYSHKNAVRMGTWHNKDNNAMLTRSGYIKIGIPESILSNESNIQALQLETAEVRDGETKDYVPLKISLERLRAVEFVDLDLDTYEKCAKIQIRILYKNNITEVFKFHSKTQAVYRSKLILEAQLCVRYKTSELYEDSTEGRNSCLLDLEDKTNTVCTQSKETKGTKNLVYYTIFFDKGYIELLDKSVMSILEQSEVNFDLLLITDNETKAKLERCAFRDKITPKYLIVETPFDGVEASQNKTRVYEYEDIDSYDKILFLDCDIVCLKDINSIFNEELAHETLYTARNANIKWYHHKSFHHGFEFLGDAYVREMTHAKQMPFNAGQFLFRNSDRMRAHFNNVNWFMKNWAGEYFFEQAFLCYYFCKAYLTDDTVLQQYMSIISTTTTSEYSISEDTCLVHFIAPPLDAKTKLKFIDFFLKEHEINDNHIIMSNLLLSKSSFIHIPKCAGTHLQNFLFHLGLPKYRYNTPQDGHLFLHQMTKSRDTYNFSFVRHPYTWWPSFYEWSKNTRFSAMEKECPDFDTWIQDYGAFWLGHYSRLVDRYTGIDPVYMSDVKMHFVGKTENLYEDLFTILKNAGEKFDENYFHQLVSEVDTRASLLEWTNKQEYKREISDESKELIYKTEKSLFDRFNYLK